MSIYPSKVAIVYFVVYQFIQKYLDFVYSSKNKRNLPISRKVFLNFKLHVFWPSLITRKNKFVQSNRTSQFLRVSKKLYVKTFCIRAGLNEAALSLIFSMVSIQPESSLTNHITLRQGSIQIFFCKKKLCKKLQQTLETTRKSE